MDRNRQTRSAATVISGYPPGDPASKLVDHNFGRLIRIHIIDRRKGR